MEEKKTIKNKQTRQYHKFKINYFLMLSKEEREEQATAKYWVDELAKVSVPESVKQASSSGGDEENKKTEAAKTPTTKRYEFQDTNYQGTITVDRFGELVTIYDQSNRSSEVGEEFTDDEIIGILYYFTSDTVSIKDNGTNLTVDQITELINKENEFRKDSANFMTKDAEGKIGQFKIKLQKF